MPATSSATSRHNRPRMTNRQAIAAQQRLRTNKSEPGQATGHRLQKAGSQETADRSRELRELHNSALRTTIFQQLSSKSAMPQGIKVTVPEVHVGRVKEAFRQALGRELTLAEQQSLGIPASVVSIRESSSFGSRVRVVKGINRRKTA